ncbi:hypothetical protein [Candidatus Bealeia paramacronuclearis]
MAQLSWSSLFAKNVIFVVTSETVGGKGVFELYDQMKKDGHDVTLVAIPSFYDGELLAEIDKDFIEKFDSKDVIFPCGERPPYKHCADVSHYRSNIDVIFVQNPYDSYKNSILEPNYLTSTLKPKAQYLMYTIYGPHIFHQDTINDVNLKNLVDHVYVDSESTKDIYIKRYKFPPNRVHVSGYQTYKNVRDRMSESQDQSGTDKKETILWLPRWYLSYANKSLFEGGSTFLSYHYFFYNYAKEHPEINFIIRPHILLFSFPVQQKFLSQEDFDAIFERLASLKNVTISRHDNIPLINDILKSDIVISDGTSALAEVVVADKPIIYLSNGWNNEFNSNQLSREFKNYIYFAYSPPEIFSFIEEIRMNQYKPFSERNWNESMRSRLGYLKRILLGQTVSREEFKKMLDPVENPAKFISTHVNGL